MATKNRRNPEAAGQPAVESGWLPTLSLTLPLDQDRFTFKVSLALVPLASLYQPPNSIFVNSSGIVRGDSESTTSESRVVLSV